MNEEFLTERKCCVCGRKFLPAPFHVYHKGARWCCTYSCYLKLQAQIEAARLRPKKKEISDGN